MGLRFLHTIIHLGNLVVTRCFRVFVWSVAVFAAMWVVFVGLLGAHSPRP